MVMAQSLFKLLKSRNPDVAIDVLAPEWSLPIVARMPEIRRGIGAETGHGEVGLAKRRSIAAGLREYGYELNIPAGALYAFPKTPIEDDAEFVNLLMKEKILAVPGRGFGRPGYMRISYCVDRQTIERALPGFKRAIEAVHRTRPCDSACSPAGR